MNKTWDLKSSSYSTDTFYAVKPVLEKIFNCEIKNCEGTPLDFKYCIDAVFVDDNGNCNEGIAFRAQRKLYKTFSIRYKKSFGKTMKTEYDKLMDPSVKIKPKYHVQVFDAGGFFVIGVIPTSDLIDYMTINNLDIKTNPDGSQFVVIPWHDLKVQGYYIKAYRM